MPSVIPQPQASASRGVPWLVPALLLLLAWLPSIWRRHSTAAWLGWTLHADASGTRFSVTHADGTAVARGTLSPPTAALESSPP